MNDRIYDRIYDDTIKDDIYYIPPPIRLIQRQERQEEQHDISKKLIEDCFIMNTYGDELNNDFQITHTTIMTPRYSLYLSRNNIDKFYKDYNKIIKYNNTHEEQIFISITEKPPLYSMYCIDIDLNEVGDITRNLYNDSDILRYINITNDTIRQLRPYIKNKYLECIVLTKPPYIKNGKIKHGIHIQYINLFIHKDIRKLIQKTSNIGDSIYNNNWLLFGSVKNEWTGTYKLYKIYDYNLNEIGLLDFLNTYKIYNSNEVRYKPTIFQLSQVLSIYPFNRDCLEGFISLQTDNIVKFNIQTETNGVYNLDELTNICNKLSIEQSDNYKTWYIVGQAIFNITNGNKEGLELYKSFSSLSSKYNERETTTKYKKFNKVGTFNIDTLIRLL
jgi:hypothetical protein